MGWGGGAKAHCCIYRLQRPSQSSTPFPWSEFETNPDHRESSYHESHMVYPPEQGYCFCLAGWVQLCKICLSEQSGNLSDSNISEKVLMTVFSGLLFQSFSYYPKNYYVFMRWVFVGGGHTRSFGWSETRTCLFARDCHLLIAGVFHTLPANLSVRNNISTWTTGKNKTGSGACHEREKKPFKIGSRKIQTDLLFIMCWARRSHTNWRMFCLHWHICCCVSRSSVVFGKSLP